MANKPPFRLSPGRSWYEDSIGERPTHPPLDGALTVDVLVVGGGTTGLSAAYHLARAGVSVAALEAGRLGDGASGRSGGQIGTGPRHSPTQLAAELGMERAKALFDLSEEAKSDLLAFIREQNADVDYRPGQLSLAHRRRDVEDYRREADELAIRFGYRHARFMDGEETAARLGSSVYFGGMRDTGTGHLHPLKLTLAFARAARQAGAKIFEEAPVTGIERKSGRFVAETPAGPVSAERVLLATNAYGRGLERRMEARVLPIGSFIAATPPLDKPDMVLPGGEAAADSRFVVRYFRKSFDGRLLFGGSEAYSATASDPAPELRRQIAAIFPRLADVPFTHVWGGWVGVTRTRLPMVEAVQPGLTVIAGFSGHGVALSPFSGRLYAERIAGLGDRLAQLEEMKTPPLPGGAALRSPLLYLAMTWFSLRDRL
ncbi:NAD(P)/FAD-dependent oxidoreductase [Consotaella salsifontis]|uniref:Gamma-glutamylputrescine oxidase n=1 Tax=Consotaella salsifontis TaxID=1365950 RepID=A0A1T4Q1Z0_9HYPH|nr:FAD-binding oxidoreductase [Consotaella salsifontis]SJZ97840.1 gamma-glutamylputrescine oxidase [Consotaella salsifontis]